MVLPWAFRKRSTLDLVTKPLMSERTAYPGYFMEIQIDVFTGDFCPGHFDTVIQIDPFGTLTFSFWVLFTGVTLGWGS